ncbi:hypothetical protein E2F43_10765 [Seongchinamella unica]|uniref:Helix-turn-helix domain-containing protein n=1 Tax=Seongchinamella unica TaxID=2547392 RepID=A0A4R5LSS5_9GAMM|nr:hypothetical protein [Seongchinamella unica]TDG13968.1 hypothetical protein E2F43_10765 [Seongchinamella unica]
MKVTPIQSMQDWEARKTSLSEAASILGYSKPNYLSAALSRGDLRLSRYRLGKYTYLDRDEILEVIKSRRIPA